MQILVKSDTIDLSQFIQYREKQEKQLEEIPVKTEREISIDHIRQFTISISRYLNKSMVAKDCKCGYSTIDRFIKGESNLSDFSLYKLCELLKYFGMNGVVVPEIPIDEKAKPPMPAPEIDKIKEIVYGYFNTPECLLNTTTRKTEIVQARQISIYFCRKLTHYSLAVIGDAHSRDHGTVIHSVRTVKNHMEIEKGFKEQIDKIGKLLKNEQKT